MEPISHNALYDNLVDNSDANLEEYFERAFRPQINELANLMTNSFDDAHIDEIERLTDLLFSNLEKLDSNNLITLEALKVISRSYYLIKQYKYKNNKIIDKRSDTTTNNSKTPNLLSQQKEEAENHAKIFHKQNEELLARITSHIEKQDAKDKTKNEKYSIFKNKYDNLNENVMKSVGEIAKYINAKNVTNIDDLKKAVKKYSHTTSSQLKKLNEELIILTKELDDKNRLYNIEQNSDISQLENIINTQQRENSSLKLENKTLSSENEKMKIQILSEIPNCFNKEMNLNDILRTENEKITNQCIESQRQFDLMEEENQKLKEIINQKECIISELQTEKNSYKAFATQNILANHELNMPIASPKTDDIFILKTELETLKIKFKEAENKNIKLKSKLVKLKKLEEMVDELSNQVQKKEEMQQVEITKLQLENDDLRAKISDNTDIVSLRSEIYTKSSEIKRLSSTIDKLSSQLTEQCSEIANDNQIKSALLKIVEQQSSTLCEYERITIDKCNIISQHEMEMSKFSSIMNTVKQQGKTYEKQMEDLFEDLIQFAKNTINDEICDEVLFVLNKHRPQDIVAAFHLLSRKLDVSRKPQVVIQGESPQSKHLYNYLLSVVRTLRSFADSDTIININNNSTIDQRTEILRECAKIDSFIQENAPGLKEEPTIFEAFGIIVDENQFMEKVAAFVNKFGEMKDENSQELFIILLYVISMNSILRKTALSFREQCEFRAFETQKLKSEVTELRSIIDRKDDDEHYNNREKEEENVDESNNRRKERKERKERPTEEKYAKLKQKYCHIRGLYNDAKNSSQEIIKLRKKTKALTRQNEDLRKRISTHKDIIEEVSVSSEKSNTAIKSLQNELLSREAEIEASTTIIKKQREEIDEFKKIIEAQTNAINERNDTERAKLEEKKQKAYTEEFIEKIKIEHQHQIIKMNRQIKSQISKINSELEYEKTRNDTLKAQYEPLIQSLREKLNESRSQEMKAKSEFNTKDSEINNFKAKISSLTVENKIMKMKVSTLEEKANREKAMNSNQNKAQQIAMEQQITTQMNEYESKMKRREQLYLTSLCEMLHEYIEDEELDESVTPDTVRRAVRLALNDIKRLQVALNDTKIITNEISRIRAILRPKRTEATAEAVQHLVNQRDDLLDAIGREKNQVNSSKTDSNIKSCFKIKSQLQPSEQNQNTVNSWNSWARKLCTMATDSTCTAKSDTELKNSIEEIVMGSFGLRSSRWKNESLKKQKKILLSRLPLTAAAFAKPSIMTLLIIYAATRRMQKMAGHLHTDFSIPTITKEPPKQKQVKFTNEPKKYPLINSYE